MLNRSINRDYDINYFTRVLGSHLDDIVSCVDMLRAVGYEPTEQLVEMGELWKKLTNESEHI